MGDNERTDRCRNDSYQITVVDTCICGMLLHGELSLRAWKRCAIKLGRVWPKFHACRIHPCVNNSSSLENDWCVRSHTEVEVNYRFLKVCRTPSFKGN